MLEATDHFTNVGAVLVNSLPVDFHTVALVKIATIDCEASQNVDVIVHVLHQTSEEGLLTIKKFLPFFRSVAQKPDDAGEALCNSCYRSIVDPQGMPEPKFTVP